MSERFSPTPEQIAVKEITTALAAPFEPQDIKFKPQAVKGNRALAVAYLDVRVIQDRLDEVLGVENWQDAYQLLPDNSVLCKLRVKIDNHWITKMDVGSPSEQPDSGDRLKAAFSDALKRAAVKFGIGRYLHKIKPDWCDYDPAKKQFVRTPPLPAFAMPKAKKAPDPAFEKPAPEKQESKLPADGVELQRRLSERDAEWASEGRCPRGALLAHIIRAGTSAGYGSDITRWDGKAIEMAVAETRAFKAKLPAPS